MSRATTESVDSFDPAKLRAARERRHLSLDVLGERIGAPRQVLVAYERAPSDRTARKPSPALLAMIAEALDVDPWDLTAVDRRNPTLADLRARIGATRAYVADQLGVTQGTYYRIERGQRDLTTERASQLARLLDVSEATVTAARRRGLSR